MNFPTATIADKLGTGTQVLVIGMLMVFAVLGVIFLVLQIFNFIFSRRSNAPKKEAVEVAPVNTAPVRSNDEEIVAVIAAAIAAAESETPESKFRVVSFRRVS